MTPTLRRVWWVMGAATLALMLWFIWSGRVHDEPEPPAAAEAVPAASPPDAPVHAPPESTDLPVAAVHGSDEIELCGGQWVKAKPDGSIDDEDFARVVRLPEARARVIDDLRADTSEFARAASIQLTLVGSDPASPAVAEERDSLARMAATTGDPQVYALAFNTCGRVQPTEGACQLLNPEQWARLDPGNATPWLFALAQAAQRRDAAAQSEASFRISTSMLSDQHFFAVPGLVIDHMPSDDASMPAALMLASEVIGVEAAWSLPGYQALYDLCKASTLRDANRRQTCTAVAELLVEHSDTLLERGVGIAIGKRLGWPDERIERLRGEQTAYFFSPGASTAQAPVDGCNGIRRDLATVIRHARLGEAGALREWVAQSGKEAADFILAEREAQAKAAAAASAASAAR